MTEPAYWATCGICGIKMGADTEPDAARILWSHLQAMHPDEIQGAPV